MTDGKSNILFLMADQMGAKALSFINGRGAKAPHLEALAARGTLFENAYCSFPLCAPSRFAMMTGQLPSRIGAYDNGAELPSAIPTFVHYLRLLGYQTCISGKLHYVGADQLHGFEERLTTDIYPADLGWTAQWERTDSDGLIPKKAGGGSSSGDIVNDSGPYARSMQIDYDEEVFAQGLQKIYDLARAPTKQPFFLKISFTQPHDPYVTPREFWDLHDPDEIPRPAVPDMAMDERDAHSQELCRHYSIDRFPIPPEATQRARRAYFGMIGDIDRKIGRILQALEETGFARNTAVVFTSDHGDMMGERGLWFKKTFFEGAMRVPLILTLPGAEQVARVRANASHLDLLPTLVEIAGGRSSQIMGRPDGVSLLPSVTGTPLRRDAVLAEHLDEGTSAPRFMVCKGPHKFVFSRRYPAQLYDLERDPDETENLAGSPAMADLVESFERIVAETWDPDGLHEAIVRSQQARGLVHAALTKGRWSSWDHVPAYDAHDRFVRHRDGFPEVERRGYLPYASD